MHVPYLKEAIVVLLLAPVSLTFLQPTITIQGSPEPQTPPATPTNSTSPPTNSTSPPTVPTNSTFVYNGHCKLDTTVGDYAFYTNGTIHCVYHANINENLHFSATFGGEYHSIILQFYKDGSAAYVELMTHALIDAIHSLELPYAVDMMTLLALSEPPSILRRCESIAIILVDWFRELASEFL